MRTVIIVVLVAISASLATLIWSSTSKLAKPVILRESNKPQIQFARDASPEFQGLDFTHAAEKTIHAVVHIRSKVIQETPRSPFHEFFRDDYQENFREGLASGSGVIINEDGYILTNNHVIDEAREIEVVLNDNRSFPAKLIGTDPTTDLAVIKIDGGNFPSLAFSNSSEVKIGQWVLAVGNPFNLSSTVTAGIVSAKARNINILREAYAVESFIQTDAAINRGNSGGALVNLNGDLIGINTAIATPNGLYAGYGFAVPSNLAKKVASDLIEYGVVQRAIMGIMIRSVDANLAERMELHEPQGVLVDSLTIEEGAKKAGIKKGDVIVEIDGAKIKAVPELMEYVAQKRPGDRINVLVLREGKTKTFDVELVNRNGETRFIARKESPELFRELGIEVEDLSQEDASLMEIEGGVKITRINPGRIQSYTSIKPGFVVTHLNKKPVPNKKVLSEMLQKESGGIMLEGKYPGRDGKYYYAFGK